MRFTHRRCQQELDQAYALLDRREEELEATTGELVERRHTTVLVEVELGHLRERVRAADAQDRERCPENQGHSLSLGMQVDELERQVAELEAELGTWREHAEGLAGEVLAYQRAESVLAGRRRRVAAAALDDAAERPAHPQSAHQATVAAAIAAMPLAYFDPEVVCDVGYGRPRWLVDGEVLGPYGTPERGRDQIAARYGLTDAELDAIEAAARAQLAAEAEAA
ncbi:hypothetical protein SAMN05421803_14322 [Nocardiopsis flavescens]|uniref:Uncharacterized protein n=1 Tax=Nocardiopsis flavescens TaxID=758803 RepID=A0A1M6WGB4_9ACTN|nr:hypothetical protein [Nocardiopsis flavescens]SHK92689.1 hypothetical protein SAMN05421803_14322 [Nocardiopsis flavescens]